MKDGKITCIIGRREQGKTLLNYTLFRSAKLPSYYITTRIERCFTHDDIVCRSIDYFLKVDGKTCEKFIFVFNKKEDYKTLFNAIRLSRNCNLFVDEASVFMSGYKVDEFVSDLIVFTRPQNINLFFTSIRPQLLSPLAISQSNLLVVFNIHNLRDLSYLEKSYGANFNQCRELDKFNFFWYGEVNFLQKI